MFTGETGGDLALAVLRSADGATATHWYMCKDLAPLVLVVVAWNTAIERIVAEFLAGRTLHADDFHVTHAERMGRLFLEYTGARAAELGCATTGTGPCHYCGRQ